MLTDARQVAGSAKGQVIDAALGQAAAQWTAKLENRKVLGFEAGEIFADLSAKAAKASPAEQARVARWVELREVMAQYLAGDLEPAKGLPAIYDAFEKLPADERRGVALAVSEMLYVNEQPSTPAWNNDGRHERPAVWTFREAYDLYAFLRDSAQRSPGDQPERPASGGVSGAKAAVVAPASESAPTIAAPTEAVTPADAALPSTSTAVTHQNTIASLDATLAAFEAALAPLLKQKGTLTAASLHPALVIARGGERTEVETVALGMRAKRFIEELDEREIYGYDVRQELAALGVRAERMAGGLRDQISRIDGFVAEMKRHQPKEKLGFEDVDAIIRAVDDLFPCDRKVGAERALDRYFDNGAPRGATAYEPAQKLVTALRSHIRP